MANGGKAVVTGVLDVTHEIRNLMKDATQVRLRLPGSYMVRGFYKPPDPDPPGNRKSSELATKHLFATIGPHSIVVAAKGPSAISAISAIKETIRALLKKRRKKKKG